MRYINRDRIRIPIEWMEKANRAKEEIDKLSPEEINKAIDSHARIWQDPTMKDAFETCMHGKCWYCESRENRSDNPIDHFRPKKSVFECPSHPGYWWLALDWKNYRFSCTYCNSRRKDQKTKKRGGKHDHFPLVDETKRANNQGDPIGLEEPCLLDPMNASDPRLIWFDQFGRAIPKSDENISLKDRKRAEKSIYLYNLNHTKIRERRGILHDNIIEAVEYIDDICPENYRNFSQSLNNLAKMICEDAEFSVAARAYLSGLRNKKRKWLQDLLETC